MGNKTLKILNFVYQLKDAKDQEHIFQKIKRNLDKNFKKEKKNQQKCRISFPYIWTYLNTT